ncbi:unnamed protein product [Linum tenue]|uniref:F-box domain-containing protein n=1 Tax=Linum tenue TaxID=586396 RepID=A0AAV0R8M0_9ROSI|nr:unnamed protein product [Linum tenue]
MEEEIDRLPTDLLSHIFAFLTSFTDLAQASGVCRKWKEGVKQSVGRRRCLSFAGWKMDDDSTARLVHLAFSLKELDMFVIVLEISKASSLQHLNIGGTFVTDDSLFAIAESCPHLKVSLVNKCRKLEAMDVWGTRVPVDCFIALLAMSPALHIKAAGLLSNNGGATSASMLPVA